MIITLNHCEWNYEESGGPCEEAVLFLHGWGCDGQIFAPIMKQLQRYRLITLDFPGHGKSSEPDTPWGVADFAKGVLELLDHLDIVRCSVIAHSFGGRVAIYMAATHPERISRLVLCGSAGIRPKTDPEKEKKKNAYQRQKELVIKIGKLPGAHNITEKLMDALRNKYGSADYKALSPGMRQTFVKIVNEDLTDSLGSIKASTLLIWGENDQETPLWMGQQMEKTILDAGLVVFEGGDHFAFLKEYPRFVRIVNAFLPPCPDNKNP